jgi:hypothetical protein
MNKKLLWVVAGLVILAGVAYGGYWLGGKNALVFVSDWLSGAKAVMYRDASGCYHSGGHVICWSGDGLRITSIDGGPR